MGVYRLKIKGRRKPILTKADSQAKARDSVVTAESLTAEEMADALNGGEKLWTPGEDLPADEPEPKGEGEGAPAEKGKEEIIEKS